MIRINLLPHREARRKERTRRFLSLLVGAVLAAGATWYLGSLWLNDRIASQDDRNKLLKTEITKLDREIEEIKRLKEQTASLLARKQVVEALQTNRAEAVKLIDQIGRIPEGIYLKAVKQTDAKVNVAGYAQSNARVSALMRDLEVSPVVRSPELVEVKAATVSSQRTNEFSLNTTVRQAVVIDPAKAVSAPTPTKSDAARQAVMNQITK